MQNIISTLSIGQKARLQRTFTDEDVKICCELTKEFNPLYDREKREWEPYYSKPIVPGILTEGLISQIITDIQPGGKSLLLQKELIYSHPVHIGDTITAELEIIDVNLKRNWVTQRVSCFNTSFIEVIRGQLIILVLDTEGDINAE